MTIHCRSFTFKPVILKYQPCVQSVGRPLSIVPATLIPATTLPYSLRNITESFRPIFHPTVVNAYPPQLTSHPRTNRYRSLPTNKRKHKHFEPADATSRNCRVFELRKYFARYARSLFPRYYYVVDRAYCSKTLFLLPK